MSQGRLERECDVYARYLTGREPSAYVLRKYAGYHAEWSEKVESSGSFDRFLVDISARNPFWTRLADTYAGRFHKTAALRKKLVLTLALLECSPGSFELLDAVDGGGSAATLVRLARQTAIYAGSMVLAILLFLPVEAWTSLFVVGGKAPAVEN